MASAQSNRIFFITPFFGNTGSEVALFNLIVRLKDFEVIVISRARGTLAERLPKHVSFYDYRSFYRLDEPRSIFWRIKSRLFGKGNSMTHFLDSTIGEKDGVVYVNTILMPDVVNYLTRTGRTFLLHWHELAHMFFQIKESDLVAMVSLPKFIFASSQHVKKLLKTVGRGDNVEVIYPGIDIAKVDSTFDITRLKSHLKIDQAAYVIAMSGTLDINKNPELFLEIGKTLRDKGINIHLLWIGVHAETAYNVYLRAKMNEYMLGDCCSWVNTLEGDEYVNYLNLADCFLLTSRQESFSIVLIEALALGKPVFSFDSGGPREIIDSDLIGRISKTYTASEMARLIESHVKGEISFAPNLARERATAFSADIVFEKWMSRLHAVL